METILIFLLIPIIILFIYIFKVFVAYYRMNKFEIYPPESNTFHFYLPVLTVILIIMIARDKKFKGRKTNISVKKMFINFNFTMDLIAMIVLVGREKGRIKKNATLLEKVKEDLEKFFMKNKTVYGFA